MLNLLSVMDVICAFNNTMKIVIYFCIFDSVLFSFSFSEFVGFTDCHGGLGMDCFSKKWGKPL